MINKKEEEIKIIYEDDTILVCIKPSGIPSQSDKTADYDMVNRLINQIYRREPEKGIPYIGLIHRLDRPVEGVMVFSKQKKAVSILNKQFQKREARKKYLAVLTAELPEVNRGQWITLKDYLISDPCNNTSKIIKAKEKNAKEAILMYRLLDSIQTEESGKFSLVEIELQTGRHHQIRVQMAEHIGAIWGDTKYNPVFQTKKGWFQIALFSYFLEFFHPNGRKMDFWTLPTTEPFLEFDLNKLFSHLHK